MFECLLIKDCYRVEIFFFYILIPVISEYGLKIGQECFSGKAIVLNTNYKRHLSERGIPNF